MLNGPWLLWAIVIVVIASVIALPVAIAHEPKNYVYLSPDAYEYQMTNLEFLRRNAVEASTSQLEIDEVNGRYDHQESKFKIKGGKHGFLDKR
jgi:hypothetical protein